MATVWQLETRRRSSSTSQQHWPTDDDNTYVDFVREGACGNGTARWQRPLAAIDGGTRRWRIGVSFRRAGIGSEIHPAVERPEMNALAQPLADKA